VSTIIENSLLNADRESTFVRYHRRAVPFSEADTRAKLIAALRNLTNAH